MKSAAISTNTKSQSPFKFSDTNYRLISGALAGIASRTFVAPIERIIILRQTNYQKYNGKNLLQTISQLVKSEGSLSLFKGNLANCYRIGPYQAIEFFLFDFFNKNLVPYSNPYIGANVSLLLSGALSGGISFISVYPFDLTKTILAVQDKQNTKYSGIIKTMCKIVADRGILGLFKGMSAGIIGMTPYASLKLTFFKIIQRNCDVGYISVNKDIKNMVYGGISGCMALSITYPTDVIRRRLQIQIINEDQKMSYIQTMRSMYRMQGLKIFYYGIFATYLKVIPSTAIAFTINEKLKSLRQLN